MTVNPLVTSTPDASSPRTAIGTCPGLPASHSPHPQLGQGMLGAMWVLLGCGVLKYVNWPGTDAFTFLITQNAKHSMVANTGESLKVLDARDKKRLLEQHRHDEQRVYDAIKEAMDRKRVGL